jgi:D-alanyl-D-alanine carboxypeptidase/D-alanyl-D-alanine-endopeptidase (penicillin-binding protein 4)
MQLRAQGPEAALRSGMGRLMSDEQMTFAIVGMHVIDRSSGKVVFDHNGRVGLVPASSQKVLTSIAALDLLGPDFRYETRFGYRGEVVSGVLKGALVVEGDGDPTFGSHRFRQSNPEAVAKAMKASLASAGITKIAGGVEGRLPDYEKTTIPGGWLWEDVGNYYGAGHGGLNWHENQYELWLRPGDREGGPVEILRTDPLLQGERFDNELVSGKGDSGDQAFLYFKPGGNELHVRGSVPCCTGTFRIAGAVMDPSLFAVRQIARLAEAEGPVQVMYQTSASRTGEVSPLMAHRSPSLDSINHWFLQKSVNLFGEAFIHSLAQKRKGFASFEGGVEVVRAFWAERGMDRRAVGIVDGSGLSPQNRVTAEALARAMRYAMGRPWFPAFDRAMPVHSGIRMKSGTMGGVRSYAGYLKGRDGREYCFAVIVNNFSGSGAAVNRKLWDLLEALK